MKQVYLLASGDLRESANQVCWPAQAEMEQALGVAARASEAEILRAHQFDPERGHGFIASQREGMDVFRDLPPDAPIIVAQSAWQYSHHVLPGLIHHKGPILTVANWSGQWPGLVGMLNLNGSLTKAGVPYATLWSEGFTDAFFLNGLRAWLETGSLVHEVTHVRDSFEVPDALADVARDIAETMRRDKMIMGVFDEGCMGMFNAIIPDHLLHSTGVFKERLSQSALYYETTQVPQAEGQAVLEWLEMRGMRFEFGEDDETELTRDQVIWQGRMYVAAVRIAHQFGCDAIGIQYQQGLKDLLPASDLVEGLLNNADRPPVLDELGREIRPGQPIIHFNEVDECAGLDALLTNRVQTALGLPVETTLHDVRWGDEDRDGSAGFVWVFEISGATPPAHHVDGYAGSIGYRQPPMYFRLGGSTLAGIAKPGSIVWSRIFIEGDALHMDIGTGQALALSKTETQRRLDATTPQWPIMHAQLDGIDRDKLMARHKANHVNVVYATSPETALEAALCRASLAQALGIKVHLAGI
jgi:L-fucose isomerase-like protein